MDVTFFSQFFLYINFPNTPKDKEKTTCTFTYFVPDKKHQYQTKLITTFKRKAMDKQIRATGHTKRDGIRRGTAINLHT